MPQPRCRPGWPRPVKVGQQFVLIAAALAVLLSVLIGVGATSFALTGYGGSRELIIALAILGGSLVLYAFRRVVQDRAPLRLRDPEA